MLLLQSVVKNSILNIIYKCTCVESRKMVLMNLFAGQQWRHRHREQNYGHGGGAAGGTNRESSLEIYTLWYIKWIASGNLLYDARNSKPVLCDHLEVGDGLWGGREVQEEGTCVHLGLIHVDAWQKPAQYCKALILQLKINVFFKRISF